MTTPYRLPINTEDPTTPVSPFPGFRELGPCEVIQDGDRWSCLYAGEWSSRTYLIDEDLDLGHSVTEARHLNHFTPLEALCFFREVT